MEQIKEKIARPEVTDDAALDLLKAGGQMVSKIKVATKFVPRTILYPITMEYKPGVYTNEVRAYVRQYEYTSEARWEKALEMEKKYPKLNKEYSDALKAKGLDINVKEPGNPLKATVIEMK